MQTIATALLLIWLENRSATPFVSKIFRFLFNQPIKDFVMNTDSSSNMARDAMPAVRKASDDLLQSAGKVLDSTRDHANDALDRAESKMREFRGNVDPMVDLLATKAQKLARQSLDIASEAKDRAERSLKQAADATTRYVSEQPMKSVFMAAGIGALVALIVSMTRSGDKNRY